MPKSRNVFLLIILMLFFLCIADLYARDPHAFPRGCEEVGFHYENKQLVLNDDAKQSFYLFQNTSEGPIQIKYKALRPVFMNVGYESTLSYHRWAALATDEKAMHFECINQPAENAFPVNCETVLRVCQYPRVKFSLSNRGIYWAAKNKSLWQSQRQAREKGINLHW